MEPSERGSSLSVPSPVISFTASSSVISGCSSSTSTMRLPQAMERVSTIITMATIIRAMRISEA